MKYDGKFPRLASSMRNHCIEHFYFMKHLYEISAITKEDFKDYYNLTDEEFDTIFIKRGGDNGEKQQKHKVPDNEKT